ncbi:type 2 periplasmic-binding domain-containing protein [Cohnella rhizosphaerae]|uniref:Uncharacterized protein n=1 Tax=Cohnella rhizosphaerae TaxID=1457232 RepID=A0A9X4KPX7_9BACL|nr:hypothetical protein [Cohnella rhizosphaerae]MDG0808607.1 hypothetical protein [Cohnella rhizosphaerae]
MKRKAMLLAGLVTLTASGVLAGCSGNGSDNDNEAAGSSPAGTKQAQQSEALSPATLKIYIPGDRPKDMDAVIAEAEKRMEGTLNVKLNITFIPWSDLDNKTSLALASGGSRRPDLRRAVAAYEQDGRLRYVRGSGAAAAAVRPDDTENPAAGNVGREQV